MLCWLAVGVPNSHAYTHAQEGTRSRTHVNFFATRCVYSRNGRFSRQLHAASRVAAAGLDAQTRRMYSRNVLSKNCCGFVLARISTQWLNELLTHIPSIPRKSVIYPTSLGTVSRPINKRFHWLAGVESDQPMAQKSAWFLIWETWRSGGQCVLHRR